MKWIPFIPWLLILTACGFTNPKVVEYQQVIVTHPKEKIYFFDDSASIDVTNTTVTFK